MPYIKPMARPFNEMHKLLKAYGLTSAKFAVILGCSLPTAKKKLDNPEKLTLEDLDKINRFGHVPIEELREAVKK